jgi:hypothetical protein
MNRDSGWGRPRADDYADGERGQRGGYGGDPRFERGEHGGRTGRDDERDARFGEGRRLQDERSYDRDWGGRGARRGGGPPWGNESYASRGHDGRWAGMSGYQGGWRGEAEGWGNEGYTGGRERGGSGERCETGERFSGEVKRKTGRGPKGYVRSDARIREDLCDRLCDHEWVDASDIEVNVKDGEITLTGVVADRLSKRTIEDLADSVSGVKDVQNQLRVRRDEPAREASQPARESPEPATPRGEKTPRA